MTLVLKSDAFDEGGEIPLKYTCEGGNVSPGLYWGGLPAGTQSLVLIIDDPDTPDPAAPRMVWDHWILYNLPPSAPGLAEGATAQALPAGCVPGLNSWGHTDYGGPCPSVGRHRYFFALFALDTRLPSELGNPTKNDLLLAMEDHILARTALVGTYAKGAGCV